MGMSYKGCNQNAFVIFDGQVFAASIAGTNSNCRGVVTGNRIRIPKKALGLDGDLTMPLVTDLPKKDIFKDEEAATRALFIRKLKGEPK